MLCQLSSVKTRLKIDRFDTTDDTILTNAIKAASARFDNHTGRTLERVADGTFEFPANYESICPDAYPIESVSAFELKDNETDGWEAQSDVDYLIPCSSGGVKCTVVFSGPLGSSVQRARITYSAGYVSPGTTPDTGQTALPDDVEQGCIEQVAYWYQRRHQLGLTGVSVEGGGYQAFRELDLLPSVKAMLQNYKRIQL